MLVACGVADKVAADLAGENTVALVARYVRAFQDQNRRGKTVGPGWLVRAIAGRWTVADPAPQSAPQATPRPAPVAPQACVDTDARGKPLAPFLAEFDRLAGLSDAALAVEREAFVAAEPTWSASIAKLPRDSPRLLSLLAERNVDGRVDATPPAGV